MSEVQRLNQEIAIVQDTLTINEMARIEKFILVHNDTEPNDKFAHFHYKDIHYRFASKCPKNITELKKLIAFKVEVSKVKESDLTELLSLLQKQPTGKNRGNYSNVYDKVLDTWETLNERDADVVEL